MLSTEHSNKCNLNTYNCYTLFHFRSISEDITKQTLEKLQQLEKEKGEIEALKDSKAALAFTTSVRYLTFNLFVSALKVVNKDQMPDDRHDDDERDGK